jgi:NAD-dependent dihydropyrimidine dehydrogenase PreA subunit
MITVVLDERESPMTVEYCPSCGTLLRMSSVQPVLQDVDEYRCIGCGSSITLCRTKESYLMYLR